MAKEGGELIRLVHLGSGNTLNVSTMHPIER